jgi:tetratricopeptide (TPR) repeat protein
MLDCQIYALNPVGHHLTSLLFHIVNVLLLFLLLREATGRVWESAAIASLFAVHPLHVESVAWVSERKDVLSFFFGMLTMLMYVRYVKSGRARLYWSSIVFFALGLMSKPMLVTMPFLLLILDFWPLGRMGSLSSDHLPFRFGPDRFLPKRIIAEKVPFLILSLLCGVVTLLAQSRAGAISALDALPINVRLSNALVAYSGYLGKIVDPVNLSVFYPHPLAMYPVTTILGACLLLAGVTALAFWAIRRQPWIMAGWVWYLIALLPVLGIIQVGFQSMADRYAYLPGIGIYIAAVFTISAGVRKLPSRAATLLCSAAAILILGALSVLTIRQVGYWQNTRTLFSHAATAVSGNWMAHGILSGTLLDEGDLPMAEAEARRALAIRSEYADGYVNLAAVLMKGKERNEEALNLLQKAVELNPKRVEAYLNMGRVYAAMNKKDMALTQYRKAEELIPQNSLALNILGIAYAGAGGYDRAVIQFGKALDLAPQRPDTCNNMGMALNLQGQSREALPYFLRAIELNPGFVEAYNNAGTVLLKIGNLEEAAFYFATALHLDPNYEKGRINLYHLSVRMAQRLKK